VGLVSPACRVHLHCLGLLLVLSQHDSALIVNISPEIFESGLSRALRLLNSLAKTVAACLKLHVAWPLLWTEWNDHVEAPVSHSYTVLPHSSILFIASSSVHSLHNYHLSLDLRHKMTASKSKTFPPSQPLVPCPFSPTRFTPFDLWTMTINSSCNDVALVYLVHSIV
jgi:hypothetical protein